MSDTDLPLPAALSDHDLARLLLSQERVNRASLQLDLIARNHADVTKERDAFVEANKAIAADLTARYGIGVADTIDAETGAITRK
jgi:hypothetical protein